MRKLWYNVFMRTKQQNIEQQRQWHEAHPDARKLYRKNTDLRLKKLLLEHYGNKCACCGYDKIDALVIDHVNGDGAKHRKSIGGGKTYIWLKKNGFPPGFQTLCANCNMAKGTGKECPIDHSA